MAIVFRYTQKGLVVIERNNLFFYLLLFFLFDKPKRKFPNVCKHSGHQLCYLSTKDCARCNERQSIGCKQ